LIRQARNGVLPGEAPVKKRRPAAGNALRQATQRPLAELDRLPLPPDLAMSAREAPEIADCKIHIRGDVNDLGPSVPRGFVQAVYSKDAPVPAIPPAESGRLQLAEWMTSRSNPLTARVMVNRIWQHLFGRGLVSTVDNFGKMGEKPTHPELLDYLAVRFMDQGWSVKKIAREIVLSRAYRMSAAHHPRNARIDPDNRMWWRMNRRRLEVEAIRDSMLAVAGQLDLERPTGSPVMSFRRGFDVGRGAGTMPEDYAVKMRHRSVYVPVIRAFLPQMFETFDFPEPSETKGRREVTTVPTQALFLMNNPFVMELAAQAAKRLLAGEAGSDSARVGQAYQEVLGRSPGKEELARSLDFVRSASASSAPEDAGAWARLYQALFASAEFRYRS